MRSGPDSMDQVSLVLLDKGDGLASESLTNVYHVPLPPDLAVAADTAHRDTGPVLMRAG